MANNKEEAGKGTPRPGEMPGSKRTYATIDLTASEVEGKDSDKDKSAHARRLSRGSVGFGCGNIRHQVPGKSGRQAHQVRAAGPAGNEHWRRRRRPSGDGRGGQGRQFCRRGDFDRRARAGGAMAVASGGRRAGGHRRADRRRADDDGPATGAIAGGWRADAAPDGSGGGARHASGRRLACQGRGDGALGRCAGRDPGQARPRDQGARRQGRDRAGVPARADGPAGQAGGGAGSGDGRRSGQRSRRRWRR